jgi:serine/threonine-protein kinase
MDDMTTEEWVGQIIGGKYRVKGLLGKGGMGLVLHGEHVRLSSEEVAIKLLLPAMREVAGMTTRFLREAQAASKIKSRHVARVTDVDVMPDGTPYMIMEYLDGVSLAVLRRQRGALPIPDAVRFVLEACDAIGEAHALGIVHRDLKPANLFLAQGHNGEEIVKVLDFGISKVESPGEEESTKTGQMMGSPKYMAPEQMLSMHDVDGRSDIWSLGAILYDFVAGRTPFMADTTPQLCALVLHGTPPPPRQFRADLPEGLEAVILRCLERQPERRYASIAELVAALAPFAPEGTRIPAPRLPSSGQRHTGSWSGVRPSLLVPEASAAEEASLAPEASPAPEPDRDQPTAAVPPYPGARRSSAAPSAHGATVSVWNAALHERAPSRRSRAIAVAAVALVLVCAGSALAVRRAAEGSSLKASATPSTVSTEIAVAPLPAPVAPLPAATARETADTKASAPDPTPAATVAATTPIGTATTAPVATVRGPLRGTKKTGEASAAQADPFAGKRR